MKYSVDEKSRLNSSSQPQAEKTPSDFWLSLRSNVRVKHQTPAIQPVSRNQNLPLSFNQERLWYLEQLQPDTSVHNLLHCLHFQGELNVVALQMSLGEIIRRHEILRTTFPTVNGLPIQVISPDIDWTLPTIDLQELPLEQRKTEAQRLAAEDAELPFDLTKSPLWRIKLLRLTEQEHILVRTIHHIIFDGWSDRVFLRELGVLYNAFSRGKLSLLSELPVQYADYAQTQRQWLQGKVFSYQLDYWQDQLSGNISALELPTDYPRPPVPSYQGAYQPLQLSETLTKALKTLSYQEGVSLFVTLLAAFKTLLYLYTKQEDMIVCSPVVGRHQVESKRLIGYFNNIVAVRSDLSKNPSFRELLHRVSQVSSRGFAHQDVPLQTVAQLPSLVHTPLTRAMFILQNTPNPSVELDGLRVNSVYVNREIANFDLSLSMQELAGQLTGGVQYKTNLFSASTITQLLENFQRLLESLVTNPEQCLENLSLFTPKSRQRLDHNSDSASFTPKPKERFVVPRNDVERQLTTIWQNVLGIHPIGVKDNFFNLGGYSLLAVSLFAEIENVFGKKLPLSTLIEAPTIENLAALLNPSGQSEAGKSLVLLKDGKAKPPLFLIHDGDGETLLYRNLAYRLNSDRPVYGIQTYHKQGQPILHTRIADMVAYYIEQIRHVQPQGPYLLGGMCAGGILAFEIARQLQRKGQTVALVALIDAADVQAAERPNRIANQRLNRFSEVFSQSQQFKLHQRLFYILNQVKHKAFNFIAYKTQTSIQTMRDKVKMNLFRYYLDKKLPLPPFLHNIPVRTTFLFAENEYVPDALYQGEVVLFRATEVNNDQVDITLFGRTQIDDEPYVNIYSDPLLGWGKRVSEGVKVYDIPGGHSSMLQEPNVQVMAEKMQAYIDAALLKASASELEPKLSCI